MQSTVQSAEDQLRAASPAAAAQPLTAGVGAGVQDIRVVTASNTMGWALDAPSRAQLTSPLLLMHGAIQGGWVWKCAPAHIAVLSEHPFRRL